MSETISFLGLATTPLNVRNNKSPCGFVVKHEGISLYQLQYCNVSFVLDYKPLQYCIRVDDTFTTVYYYKVN